jgi:hypothetical protein
MYASKEDAEGPAFYSAMIREDLVERVLKDASWDLHIGDGAPGLVTQYENGNEETWYSRPSDEGIEPFALRRSFHGIRPPTGRSQRTFVSFSICTRIVRISAS